MSTTGCVVGTKQRVATELSERTHRVDRPLGRPTLALEHEAAHRGVNRRELAVEQLLGVVRLGGDVCALAELEHGLEDRRRVTPGANDGEACVLGRTEMLAVELAEDVGREAGDVLALESAARRDRACVARRVAVAVLDRRARHDHVIDILRDRAVGGGRDEPRLASEAADRLVRERASRPRAEIATSTSASGACPSTISSACTAFPHASAA